DSPAPHHPPRPSPPFPYTTLFRSSINIGIGRPGSSTPATGSSGPRPVSSRQAPQECCGELGGMAAPHLRQNVPVVILIVRPFPRSEEHTSELQSPYDLVCRLLLEK